MQGFASRGTSDYCNVKRWNIACRILRRSRLDE